MFAFALWLLHRALREYHYRDVVAALGAIPRRQVLAAFACAACSYLCLTLHDVLAFRYVGQRLAYPRVAFASFVGYAISNSVGYSFLSGGSVRYRLYSSWSLPPTDITRIVAFCTTTGWLGFGALAGTALVLEPTLLSQASNADPTLLRAAGALVLLVITGYLAACAARLGPVRRGGWEFPFPSFALGCAQVIVSAIDHAFVAATLYMLLPAGVAISYPAFAGVFVLALAGGLISQVPGGAGVFETCVVTLLASTIAPTGVMAALVTYRAIYYLGPLASGTVLILLYELRSRRAAAKRLVDTVGPWLSPVVPQILAFTTFVNGGLLMFSGATPPSHGRIEILRDLLPLPVVEISHFLASVTGAVLVLVARSIQRRVDAAFLFALGLLFAGGVFSLLKGIDYEEAAVSFTLLALLAPCRRYFYRKASLFEERFTPGWLIAILLIFVCAGWLTLFAFKHVEYSDELWWHFSFRGDVHRSMRAIVGAAAVSLLFATAHLLRPARPDPAAPLREDLDAIAPIIDASPSTLATLAYLGDKALLLNDQRTAFIMYRVERRSWIALGDPIGPEAEWVELIWRFREMSDRHSGWTVFYQVPAASLHHYLDLGLVPLKLGEEARVDMAGFSLEGGAHKAERNALHKLEREGVTFEIVPRESVPALLPQLHVISDDWLAHKNTREKGFSIGSFDEAYLCRFPHAIVRSNGVIRAFANVVAGGNKEEFSVDLMRYAGDAPAGLMDFLFVHLMLWGKSQGYRWFNLGMAPLSGLEDRPLAPMWNRVSALVYRHGEHFYNFKGLRKYKQKFNPKWQPRYLVSPGGLALPAIVTNLASVISRGMGGVLLK